jgi:O-antigen/teichoic acid export membrane protein
MYSSMEIIVLPGNRQVKDSTSREYGGPMQESWENYDRQRRRLHAKLGLLVFALLPLPAILIAIGLSPLRMLLLVTSLGMSIGILYPMWWRTKHNPFRASAIEARTRRIAWVCRPVGFLCSLAATLFWSVGGAAAEFGGVAFGVAAALLLWFSYFSDKKAEQDLPSTSH